MEPGILALSLLLIKHQLFYLYLYIYTKNGSGVSAAGMKLKKSLDLFSSMMCMCSGML